MLPMREARHRGAEQALAATGTAGVLGSGLSLCLLLLLTATRSGLATPPLLAVLCWLVLTAAAFAPFALPRRWQRALAATPWSLPLVSLAVLLSPVLALVVGRGLGLAYPVLAVAGAAGALRTLRAAGAARLSWLLLGVPPLAAYLFLEIHAPGFAHAYAPEFAQAGNLGLDTTFHMAMSHLIQNFGSFSTGLDGLVPFDYHHGSHVWFAGLAEIAGTTPVYAYPYGQISVAVPALYWALFAATSSLAPDRRTLALRLLLTTATVLAFDRIGWNSYYISESYTFGLVALLLAVPLLEDSLTAPKRSPREDGWRIASMLAVVAIAACMKISVGAVLGAAFGWLVLRTHGFTVRSTALAAGLLGIAAFVWLELKAATGLAPRDSIAFLDFYRSQGVVYLNRYRGWTAPLLPLLYIAALGWQLRPSASRPEAERATLRRTLEVVGLATLLALLPGLVLRLFSGTAWWFANVPHWLVLPLALCAAPLERLTPERVRLASAALAVLLTGVLCVGLVGERAQRLEGYAASVLVHSGAVQFADVVERHEASRSYHRKTLSQHSALFGPEVHPGLARSTGARLIARVDEAFAGERDAASALFLPPVNVEAWQGGPASCMTAPLRVPALTGLPLIKGLAPRCPLFGYLAGYGYGTYGEESRSETLDREALCQHARSLGIRRVLRLPTLRKSKANRLVTCDP